MEGIWELVISWETFIYSTYTADYMCIQGAHDGEILSLSFSLQSSDAPTDKFPHSHYFLASGGKDGMIHLYDVQRSLVFCDVSMIDSGYKISCYHRVLPGVVYDMTVDACTGIAVTVGQDKKINIFGVPSGKLIRSFKHIGGDPIKVSVDPSSSYLVCPTLKILCLYDIMAGDMVAQAVGHGDVITGVIFLPVCKHLVSYPYFCWKLAFGGEMRPPIFDELNTSIPHVGDLVSSHMHDLRSE
ncbi:hypothetical protein RND71_021528 [Anisodus tanguticus]|uniref:Uncharacterized protein n=1 Tax=Anisodus tanguticus TaxID=243964 RepID=A0AAE1RY01_9SOLA|nr:hypothetical protein RND71_021528 [Anisodus tanguticus]